MNAKTTFIADSIRKNSKRMAKLQTLHTAYERRKQARAFIVAECAVKKIKLSGEEIGSATAMTLAGLCG